MEEIKKTKPETQNKIEQNSLIIDKLGKIIACDPKLKSAIPGIAPQANFFDLFDEKNLLTLQKIFIDTRKYDDKSKDIIEIKIGSVSLEYEVSISPLRSENNIYYLITFKSVLDGELKTDLNKFFVAASELEKITDDKRILTIVNKIKLSYPFTFIEKAKIQKEINELSEFFWLKSADNKFILINDSYASSLGFTTAHLENKNVLDFLPKYLVNLYNTIDQYIIGSTNAVIFESFTTPIASGMEKEKQLVEFPICDLDKNVVAIIGFSQKSTAVVKSHGVETMPEFYKQIPLAMIMLNSENKISAYSDEFVKVMLLNANIDYRNSEIGTVLDKQLTSQIAAHLGDENANPELRLSHTFVEKGNLTAEVLVQKLNDLSGSYSGAQIIFNLKNELQLLHESKSQIYDVLIQDNPLAMFIYDLENLKFLEVNDAALKMYGYKRNDFLNMDLTDLYAPEDIQTLIQAGEQKTLNTGLWRHKRSDGSSLFVELQRTSIEFKGKKAHLNLVRNVTEEMGGKKRNQILQTTFENSSDLIINTDKDGFIEEINEHVTKKLGYSKKELETRPFISLVSDDDRAKINKNIFHSGLLKTTSLETDFKKPSGAVQKALVVAAPIKDFNGDIEGFTIIVKLQEEKAEGKNINQPQAEALERIDSSFLSNMFHEILTPINVILGFTQELWEGLGTPSAEQKEAVDIIKENQKLLMQIMDNAVEYSALQQKIIKFKPEEFRFVEILDELKENTKKTAESKKSEMNYGKISSSLSVIADRQKLISLLSEFLKFAIQISKESSLYLSARNYDEQNFIITIKDAREAITPYLYKGLNDVLSDEETVSRKNYGFSRFSIRLVHKLIELLSVRKEAVMKDNDILEFGLVVPIKFSIKDQSNIEVETSKPLKEQKPPVAESIHKPTLPKPKEFDLSLLSCLYLEDQVDSQILFKSQLKELKSIEVVPSFETALPLLKTKKFDFIVMDINLQGEYNGLDALRILQKMPGYKDIPVIASTAYMQPGARDNFIAAGFTDFISKPLLRDKVIETLKRIMAG
ncbi:MAG: PAS domain S-box protein [Ignavibacteriales bacterium]|nr:PAS domain S-box protein [Ignavibacteriales bacterium]